MNNALGDRMKRYEVVSSHQLVRRMPVIIRIDGKASHTYTRGCEKPFDKEIVNAMKTTMKYLCENIQGCVFGYTQSDEITLVLIDYQTLETSGWFDYKLSKMVSVSASMATASFGNYALENIFEKPYALFDSRVFNVPKEDVANNLVWRQQDAYKNAVSLIAREHYSDKELNKVSTEGRVDLIEKAGDSLENYPVGCIYGYCWTKETGVIDAPKFKENRNIIEDLILL